MRKHNGMRPQDLAILLKLTTLENKDWHLVSLSSSLYISLSEISESLNRSRQARLIDSEKKNVNKNNLVEFLEHGMKYVFPQQPGTLVRGMPTAHSQKNIKENFISEINYVWPDAKGKVMGLQIEPFYPNQAQAAKADDRFYELMALLDLVRVGKIREVNYAVNQLRKHILS